MWGSGKVIEGFFHLSSAASLTAGVQMQKQRVWEMTRREQLMPLTAVPCYCCLLFLKMVCNLFSDFKLNCATMAAQTNELTEIWAALQMITGSLRKLGARNIFSQSSALQCWTYLSEKVHSTPVQVQGQWYGLNGPGELWAKLDSSAHINRTERR